MFRYTSFGTFGARGVDTGGLMFEDFDVDMADLSGGLAAEACLAGVFVAFEAAAGPNKFTMSNP